MIIRYVALALTLCIIIVACQPRSSKPDTVTNADTTTVARTVADAASFAAFVKKLRTISLPFETDCERCCDGVAPGNEPEETKKYLPPLHHPLGVLCQTPQHVLLLTYVPADILMPVVVLFDTYGNLLYEHPFLTGYCGGDPEYYGIHALSISANLHITTVDTTYTFAVDSLYERTDTTDIMIIRRQFLIDAAGKLVPIDSSEVHR